MDKKVLRDMREEMGLSGRSCAVLAQKDGVQVSQAGISLMESGKAPIDRRYANWLHAKVHGRYKRIQDMPVNILAQAIRNRKEII